MRRDGAALIRGDALRIPLADASVDLIVTSPPYWALRSYQDDGEHFTGQLGSESDARGFLANLWAVMDECHRVLKPTGSAFVNLGDKYAGVADVPVKSLMGLPWRFALGLTCPDDYRNDGVADPPQWTLRAEIVWSKPNGLPESVTDRVRRSHEQFFHFTKQGRYFAAVDEVREKHTGNSHGGGHNTTGRTDGISRDRGYQSAVLDFNPLGKLPGSVWTIPSEPLAVPDHLGVDHFAAFPQELPRRLILGWSPNGICRACGEGRVPVVEKEYHELHRQDRSRGFTEAHDNGARGSLGAGTNRSVGEHHATITGYACACDVPIAPTRPAVILDPFSGTGTVAMVARMLGRYGIGIDLSADYLRLAAWRIWESGHAAKTMARTNRERQGALWP